MTCVCVSFCSLPIDKRRLSNHLTPPQIFVGRDIALLSAQLRVFFNHVDIVKPRSSRASSAEHFIVCLGYAPPPGYVPTMGNPVFDIQPEAVAGAAVERAVAVGEGGVRQFVVCGDLSADDAMLM